MLPYISTTKSPQQVMGSIVKGYVASKLGKRLFFFLTSHTQFLFSSSRFFWLFIYLFHTWFTYGNWWAVNRKCTMWPWCHATTRSWRLPDKIFIMIFFRLVMWTVLLPLVRRTHCFLGHIVFLFLEKSRTWNFICRGSGDYVGGESNIIRNIIGMCFRPCVSVHLHYTSCLDPFL